MRPDEKEPDGDKKRDKPKIGEGPGGWVFEIRGYTYHKDGEQFIKQVPGKNIIDKGLDSIFKKDKK